VLQLQGHGMSLSERRTISAGFSAGGSSDQT
jgi:hypothetical protein